MSGCRKPLHPTTDRICKPLPSRWAPRWKKNPERRFGRSVLSHHSRSLFTLHFSLGHRLSPVHGGHFRSLSSREGPRWLIGVAVDTALSRVRLYLPLLRISPNWYWVLTCISLSMCWTACHSKLAVFTRRPGRSCVHSNTSLMVRLATQFTINFLYLDVWLRRYILPPFWVDFPSLLSLLESSVTYFSPTLGFFFFGARVLAFSLEKAPAPFLKTPPFALIYCRSVWENVRLKWASASNPSCAAGMRLCVSAAACMCSFFSPRPVASGLSHSLPCHNKHSAAVFHLASAHAANTHTHTHTHTHSLYAQRTKVRLAHSDFSSPH